MRPLHLLALLVPFVLTPSASAQDHGDVFEAMRAREIGPAGMSGRVSHVEVVCSERNVVYVGGSTGDSSSRSTGV
jgi:hypothetical protein